MNTSDIEVRIQSLERRLNRYRSTSLILGLALVGLAGIAATAPMTVTPEVRTHQLVIVDDKGKEMIHLKTGPHGGIFSMFNTNNVRVVGAGAAEKGGKIELFDAKGPNYLRLTSDDTGGEVSVSDGKGLKGVLRPAAAAAGR